MSQVTFIHTHASRSLPLLRSPFRLQSGNARRPRVCSVTMGTGDKPPRVKSSFYKNPSKAIEKGGGFYIPGLRGPRLRFFVSTVTTSLLTLNHVASPNVQTDTLRTSELIAFFAAFCVLCTAIFDTSVNAAESERTDAKGVTQSSSTNVTGTGTSDSGPGSDNWSDLGDQTEQQPDDDSVAWALTTCTDLTPATHVAVCRSGTVAFATDNVLSKETSGPIVERVVEEQKSVFVSNTADLPPAITLPFLGDGQWSVFVVPVGAECAVTFAKRKDSSAGFLPDHRRWLETFATRLVD